MSGSISIHASCAVLDDRAVLLRGASGAGKSDLTLRLIAQAGAQLVADDRVELVAGAAGLLARAPAAIEGAIEVRGVGLVQVPVAAYGRLALVCDLTRRPRRLPEPATETLLGTRLRRIELDPFQASAVAKVQLALGVGGTTILPADWHPEDG
jgi:serine kinase of HPr protein (carbohydrate metabolism regulator)